MEGESLCSGVLEPLKKMKKLNESHSDSSHIATEPRDGDGADRTEGGLKLFLSLNFPNYY